MRRHSTCLFAAAAAIALAGCCRQHSGGGGGGGLIALDGVPTLAPSPLDFGTVGTGTTHQKGLTITNHGSGPLTLKSISIAGDPSFSAAKLTANSSLLPSASLTLSITFSPPSDGKHQATLTLVSDSTEAPRAQVTLLGNAFSYQLEVVPTELDFGEVQVGTSSVPEVVTVTNSASAPETITVGPIQGKTDFQPSPSGAQANVGAGQSFQVSVTFSPTLAGPVQATLPISACNGCTPVNVTLTGTGVDTELVVTDADTQQPFVSFGTVPQGTTATAHVQVVAVSNPPTAQSPLAATLTAAPALEQGTPGFTLTPTDANWNAASWPAALTPNATPGSTAYFVVSYAPQPGQSSVSDVVDVAYAVGSVTKAPAKLPLSAGASGSPCQQVSATPASVNFGTVLSGKSGSRTVTLTNAGPELCILTNIGVSPNDPFNEFALQGGTVGQLSLGPGQSQPYTVTFTPANGSPPLMRTAALSMGTSDTTRPTISVPLSASEQNSVYAASAWPKWHHDNGNTGYSSADTSGNQGKLAWPPISIGAPPPPNSDGDVASYIHSPVIGKDPSSGNDLIYMLGFNNWLAPASRGQPGSGEGLFIEVDGPSGQTRWSTPLTGPEYKAQESTPTVIADNSIILLTGGEQTYYPQFFHLGPDGSIIWSGVTTKGGGQTFPCAFDSTGNTNCDNVSTNPEVNDGFDTCPGFDSSGVLYLFDDELPGCDAYSSTTTSAGAPNLLWTGATPQPSSGGKGTAHVESFSAALTDQSESVFSWGGIVVALDSTGKQLWSLLTGNGQMTTGWAATNGTGTCENDSKGSPMILGADAVVSFGGFDPTCTNVVGGIVGVNLKTGAQDWGFQFPTMPPPPAPYVASYKSTLTALVAYSSPASLGDGGLVMGYIDGIYAFDPPASGQGQATQRWKLATGLVLGSPAVGGDGTVFVGSTDGNFYAINGATGALKWKYAVGAAINSSPAIGSDGTVYFAADDGNLYALR
ncbi:MAG: choice-of-anchor D domain-containing protein [Deltaproteobacteria bacterium]